MVTAARALPALSTTTAIVQVRTVDRHEVQAAGVLPTPTQHCSRVPTHVGPY